MICWVLDTEVLKVLIRKVTFFRLFSETAWTQVERRPVPGDCQVRVAITRLREGLKWKTEEMRKIRTCE